MPRGLSEADAALWSAYAARVRPLRATSAGTAPAAPAATAGNPLAQPPSVATPGRPVRNVTAPPLAVDALPAGLDRRRWRALQRGGTRPERRLDLHGTRVAEAHAAVRRFLLDAHAAGLRCVEIVTGRGGTEGGVLRRELPHWLNAPELRRLVLGATHPRAGARTVNAGAVLLLLRRPTPEPPPSPLPTAAPPRVEAPLAWPPRGVQPL